MKKILLAAATALGLASMSATAGGLAPEVTGGAVGLPVADATWTGAYAGLTFGNFDTADGVNAQVGFYGGYRQQFNDGFVLGAEAEFKSTDGVELLLLKGQAGYAFGDFLVYGTAAHAIIEQDSQQGLYYGAGLDWRITPQIVVGVEYLTEQDVDADSIVLRTGFKF